MVSEGTRTVTLASGEVTRVKDDRAIGTNSELRPRASYAAVG